MIQRSLVLIKPDAVKRGIVGEILHRFERTGLKIVAAKFVQADRELSSKHYNKDRVWMEKIGKRNIEACEKLGLKVKDIFGTDDPTEIGNAVNESNFDYLTSGPLLALVFEGVNAVEKIRYMVGETFSLTSQPGTIRGDFGLEAPSTGLIRKRTIYNMIHASGTEEEAKVEIDLWFKPEELFTYKRIHEDLYNY